jgi:hypothetical protein
MTTCGGQTSGTQRVSTTLEERSLECVPKAATPVPHNTSAQAQRALPFQTLPRGIGQPNDGKSGQGKGLEEWRLLGCYAVWLL